MMNKAIELSEMQQIQIIALRKANITDVRFLSNGMVLLSRGRRVNFYEYPNEKEKWFTLATEFNEGVYSLDEIMDKYCPLAKQ